MIMVINDPHLSDTPPRMRTDTYTDDIFEKLYEAFTVAVDRDVKKVVFTGDIFHTKAANRVSHLLVQRLMELFMTFRDIRVFIVPGNHDLSGGRLDSLKKQPLGDFNSLLNVEIVTWIGHFDSLGFDTISGIAEFMGESVVSAMERVSQVSDVLFAHIPIAKPDDVPIYPFISSSWPGFQGWKVVFYGHIHDRHGCYKVGDTKFVNYGSLSRGVLKDDNLTRIPSVCLFDEVTFNVEEVKLSKVKSATEVFKVIEKEEKKQLNENVSEFLTRLNSTITDFVSVEGLINEIKSMEIEKEVKEKAVGYLEEFV